MINEESCNEDGATFVVRGRATAMQRQPARLLVLSIVRKFFDPSAISAGDACAMLEIAPADILVLAIEQTAAKDPDATVSQIRYAAIGLVLASRKAA
jgi:hypothetical protein